MLNFITKLVVCGMVSLIVSAATGNAVVGVVAAGFCLWYISGE